MTDEHRAHATRAPSAAHRWRRCADAINAEEQYPDNAGYEAAEGTVFHEYAELALRFGLEPHDFPLRVEHEIEAGGEIFKIAYDQDMVDAMYEGLDWIRSQLTPDAILLVERRVRIEPWTLEKDGFGTADVIIIIPSQKRIIVFDWKYGQVSVSIIENDQLYLYGLGSWHSYAAEYFDGDPSGVQVDMVIEQPRVPGGGGLVTMTMKELLKIGEDIKIDAAATYELDAPRTAGPHCRYCRARTKCGALYAYNLSTVQLKFADIDEGIKWDVPPPEPRIEDITPEHRSYILLHREVFKKWLDKLHTEALLDAKAGRPVPMMKVVEGRKGGRKWKDEDTVEPMVIADVGLQEAWTYKMASPAVVEKGIGKPKFAERYEGLWDQSDPKPALVPDTDGREAIPPTAMKFDELEKED